MSATAAQMGIQGGIQIGAVVPDSPAWYAGLSANDIVTSFDNHAILPTGRTPSAEHLTPDERRLFDLVARRLMAARLR